MKAFRLAIIVMLVVTALITSALANVTTMAAAAAGKAEPQRLRWKGKTIKIAVSDSLTRFSPNIKTDSDVSGAIRRSLQAWSNAADIDLQLELSDRQSVSPNGAAGDGVSLITIAQSPENVLFFSKDADFASAKTRIFFDRRGFITEADIVLNPFQQFSTDGAYGTFDLETTLTHEIGHVLGLPHSGVLGSAMAESSARNGTLGLVDIGPRTLADSDIAAIRDLYGSQSEEEVCCAMISGKLLTATGRPARDLEIWAQETASGRVIAQSETGMDGSFRIGGLSGGDYSVYWKTKNISLSAMGDLGAVSLESGESTVINERISLRPSDVMLRYLGRNGQLADHGILLSAGRPSLLNIGGNNIDGSTKISFSSPLIEVSQIPITTQEFGDGISGVSFMVLADADIRPGNYTIFITGRNGPISGLVGAISIK